MVSLEPREAVPLQSLQGSGPPTPARASFARSPTHFLSPAPPLLHGAQIPPMEMPARPPFPRGQGRRTPTAAPPLTDETWGKRLEVREPRFLRLCSRVSPNRPGRRRAGSGRQPGLSAHERPSLPPPAAAFPPFSPSGRAVVTCRVKFKSPRTVVAV